MKIYACIPTYNEAPNIQAITRVIDQGLQLLLAGQSNAAACIVNADSASSDGTADIFAATSTATPKITLWHPEAGKGRNLLGFIELAAAAEADYCFTVDADITSARPGWVIELLQPLLSGQADFVTPLYERSRFEGSTTIHFAYPTVRGFTGQLIRQPIGGDFAFSRRFVGLVSQASKPPSVYTYGIDIFLTYLAAAQGLPIVQVPLGQKLHNPSFSKLETMFPQVAEAAAAVVRWLPRSPAPGTQSAPPVGLTAGGTPASEAAVQALYQRARRQLASQPSWVPPAVAAKVELGVQNHGITTLASSAWIDLLVAWYAQALARPASSLADLSRQLLPYFVLRTIGFWQEAAGLPAAAAEEIIEAQAAQFREAIVSRV